MNFSFFNWNRGRGKSYGHFSTQLDVNDQAQGQKQEASQQGYDRHPEDGGVVISFKHLNKYK